MKKIRISLSCIVDEAKVTKFIYRTKLQIPHIKIANHGQLVGLRAGHGEESGSKFGSHSVRYTQGLASLHGTTVLPFLLLTKLRTNLVRIVISVTKS